MAQASSAHACSALAEDPNPFKARGGGAAPLALFAFGIEANAEQHELSLSMPEPILRHADLGYMSGTCPRMFRKFLGMLRTCGQDSHAQTQHWLRHAQAQVMHAQHWPETLSRSRQGRNLQSRFMSQLVAMIAITLCRCGRAHKSIFGEG